MKKFRRLLYISVILALGLLAIPIVQFLRKSPIIVLEPKGIIGLKQMDLLVLSTLLMLIVVIPVFILTVYFVWKYRVGNTKAKFRPDWDNSVLAECIWWGVPFMILVVMSYITYTSTHELDPFKPLDSQVKPLTIQVVALQWKWLFIYPEQNIAVMNFLQFPENTPLNFEITADAPMNSFWIPQLGGQIYAMPGMRTKLHLIADEVGEYRGLSAHISGVGFADMHFVAKATSEKDFNTWVESVRNSSEALDLTKYNQSLEPPGKGALERYTLKQNDLFEQILMKYRMP